MHEILYTVYILTPDGKSWSGYKSFKYITRNIAFHTRLIAQSRDHHVKTEHEK